MDRLNEAFIVFPERFRRSDDIYITFTFTILLYATITSDSGVHYDFTLQNSIPPSIALALRVLNITPERTY